MQYVPRWLRNVSAGAGLGLAMLASGCAGAVDAGNSNSATNGNLPNLNGIWGLGRDMLPVRISQTGSYFKGKVIDLPGYTKLGINYPVEVSGTVYPDGRIFCSSDYQSWGGRSFNNYPSELDRTPDGRLRFFCGNASGRFSAIQLSEESAPDASK